jgi:hypothetical protein
MSTERVINKQTQRLDVFIKYLEESFKVLMAICVAAALL